MIVEDRYLPVVMPSPGPAAWKRLFRRGRIICMPRKKPLIGIALGSGIGRGWAHIGVLNRLEAAGLRPDIVCGTSIGALIGGSYVGGHMDTSKNRVVMEG